MLWQVVMIECVYYNMQTAWIINFFDASDTIWLSAYDALWQTQVTFVFNKYFESYEFYTCIQWDINIFMAKQYFLIKIYNVHAVWLPSAKQGEFHGFVVVYYKIVISKPNNHCPPAASSRILQISFSSASFIWEEWCSHTYSRLQPNWTFCNSILDFLISYIKMHWLVISDNLCKIELFITTLNLKMIGYVQSSNIFEKYAWAPKQKDPRGLRPTVPNHITPQHEHHMGQHCSQFTRKSKMPQKVTVVYLFEIRWIKTLSTSKTMSGLGLYIWISDYWRCCECHSEQEFHIRWQWIIFE